MEKSKKILYTASTMQHIKNFHMPYIDALKACGFVVHIETDFEKKMLSFKNFKYAKYLGEKIKGENYEVINTHTSLAAFFTRLAVIFSGTKRRSSIKKNGTEPFVVNTVHGYLFDEKSPWFKKQVLIIAEKLMAPITDKIIVMNKQDFEIAKKYRLTSAGIEPPTRVDIIPGMGIQGERFKKIAEVRSALLTLRDGGLGEDFEGLRQELGLIPDGLIFIYGAEFSKRKNQVMLIRAMNVLKYKNYNDNKFQLLLAGLGDELDSCKEIVQELKLKEHVKFLGYVNDISKYYKAADVCVTSSRSEGLPFHVMEAMASGLPVVASRVKGHEDLIKDGVNGYLYDYDDVEAFCQKLELICDRPIVIGDKNALSVNKYYISDEMVKNYLNCINKL